MLHILQTDENILWKTLTTKHRLFQSVLVIIDATRKKCMHFSGFLLGS